MGGLDSHPPPPTPLPQTDTAFRKQEASASPPDTGLDVRARTLETDKKVSDAGCLCVQGLFGPSDKDRADCTTRTDWLHSYR